MRRAISRFCLAVAVALAFAAFLPAVSLAASGSAKTFLIPGVDNINDLNGDIAICTTAPAGTPEGQQPSEMSIVAVNLSTGERQRLVTHSSRMLMVAFSGRYLVWYDERAGEHIWGYDMFTGTEFPVATNDGHQGFPGVDGDYAVWTDEATWSSSEIGAGHIRGMNLRTGERFDVSNGSGSQYEPRISNGWIIYTDMVSGSKRYIRAYQISTRKTYTLTPAPGFFANPDIGSNGIAVWTWQNNEGSKMYAYTCSVYDRRVSLIYKGTGFGGSPRVAGNIVAYPQRVKSGFQFLGYDAMAGTQFSVAPSKQILSQFMPIDDGRIAWIEQNPKTYANRLAVGSPTVIGIYSATDPYATSVAQSQQDFPDGAETVVVANGSIWDDVAVGAGLAGEDSPLLLTGRDSLPSTVGSELSRLAPKRVEVVGGASSISDSVLAQIASAVASGTVVERTGGRGAADVALSALEAGVATDALVPTYAANPGFNGTVVVVSASDKVTSGLVTPALRARHIPVVFASKRFSAREISRLRAAGVKHAIVVGGTRGVSAYAAKQLGWALGKRNVMRIAGANPYQTSVRFNEYAIKHLGMSLNGVGIAANVASIDMLMAGLKNGRAGSLLLLTGTKKLSGYVAGELKARRKAIQRALYVGRGKRLVSKAVRKSVRLIVH